MSTLKSMLTELYFKAKSGYILKISKYYRDESACLWVRKNEFQVIRDFFKDKIKLLRRGLPFIAHIDGLGISHDLMDTLGYITGRHRMTENSFLLSDDIDAWSLLAHSRCWGDLRKLKDGH